MVKDAELAMHQAKRFGGDTSVDPVRLLGQSLATIIYIRNIMLIVKNRGRGSETLDR